MDTGLQQLERALAAIRDADAGGFRSVLTKDFAHELSDSDVRDLSDQLAPQLKGGYATNLLGSLTREGSLVHLWQVSFNDGSDDALVRLVLEGTDVAGFIITPPFQ